MKIITSLLENRLIEQAELTKHKRIRLIGVSKQAAQIVKNHWPIMPNEKRRLSHILSCDCSDPAVTSLVIELERQVEDTLLPAVTSIHITGASCTCKLAPIDDICLKKQLGEWNIYIGGQLFTPWLIQVSLSLFLKRCLKSIGKMLTFKNPLVIGFPGKGTFLFEKSCLMRK